MNPGRVLRTLRSLHPLQVATRPLRLLQTRVVRAMPSAGAPAPLSKFSEPHAALGAFVEAERARIRARLPRLPVGSLLAAYERCYGLDLDGEADYRSAVALHPYPASLRARSLAVAVRVGRRELAPELCRACRAVVAQPELHLLGNHLLENGLALVCGGAVCHGAEAELWWRVGKAILDWQLPEQFSPDGGHFERSASYQLQLTAGLLQAIELGRSAGRVVPDLWLEVGERALGWARRVRAPDGTFPLFNDASLDAGPALDVTLALGDALGLGGQAREPAGPHVKLLGATGWAIGDLCDGTWLVVDAGPDGAPYQPGHAHADALSFELWVRGSRAVVDFGVASYLNDPARERTRATRSHSTVELEAEDSCEVWSAFRVGRRQTARVHRAEAVGAELHITASHDGYRHLPGSPTHSRALVLAPGRLTVRDEVIGGDARGMSRLRLDAGAAQYLRVTASGSLERMDDVWHPRYSDPRAAVVFSQRIGSGNPAQFCIEW